MKFSESWLREWVNPAVDTAELVSKLTMAGLEVDSVEPAAGFFEGVVVGEIVDCQPHPDADKLQVCKVKGSGDELLQVVCGAANARPGLKVPFATVGAVLPGDFRIKKAKLRGVESFGMLCAESELGLSDNGDGLYELPGDAPVGRALRDYLNLDDQLIEVDLTPNRTDCLSIRGLAREVGVLCKSDVQSPVIEAVSALQDERRQINLRAADACPRYIGRVIRNINAGAESPAWLVEKLRRSGLRSIDPVVDVTNYVLLELGQPMHAFDLDSLKGDITVRLTGEGEKLALLDGSDRELEAGTLVIADDARPVAMAGIMGGKETAVTDSTRHLFLESAFFKPLAIAGKARVYGLHTDSSHRFERGVDPRLCIDAMERATRLLIDIVGGEPGPVICRELTEHLPGEATVHLQREKLDRYMALAIESSVVRDIFTRLGMTVLDENDRGWTVSVPSWRFDIAIDVDLIEEIARIYGYNNLPTTTMKAPVGIQPGDESLVDRALFKRTLVNRGFLEAITYSFVDPKVMTAVDPRGKFVDVKNPISSDMAVMRTSLWAGLLTTLRYNLSRQHPRAKLFETGLTFVDNNGLQQEAMIAGLICGDRDAEHWAQGKGKVDFYDLKGHVEALVKLTGDEENFSYEADTLPCLHPGQSAALYRDGEPVGYLGKLHPSVQKQLDIDQAVYLFELKSNILARGSVPVYQPISRYPEVRRDIAIIVDRDVTAGQLTACARAAAGTLLKDIKIFDVYQGEGIENNRKSIALGLTFQELSRTLNEDEVNASVDAVIKDLEVNCQATLRG